MATMKLKLGKGSSFVKSRLQRYPQEDAMWEIDFQPIPDEKHVEFWLGLVVNQAVSVGLKTSATSADDLQIATHCADVNS